jgi:hypothetical protein
MRLARGAGVGCGCAKTESSTMRMNWENTHTSVEFTEKNADVPHSLTGRYAFPVLAKGLR